MEIESLYKFGPWPSDSASIAELDKALEEITNSLEEITSDQVGQLRYNKRAKDKSYSRQYRELLVQKLSHYGWSAKKWAIFESSVFRSIPLTEFDSARISPLGIVAVEMAFDHNGSISGNLLKGSIAKLSGIPDDEIGAPVALYVLVTGSKNFRELSKLHSSVASSEDYKEASILYTEAYKVPCVLISISRLPGIEKLENYVLRAN